MGRLSREMFYPDCSLCGKPGWAVTVMASSQADQRWRCVECATYFEAPEDSPWHGIGNLSDAHKDVYIRTVIMGMSDDEAAHGSPRTVATVARHRRRAVNAIEDGVDSTRRTAAD